MIGNYPLDFLFTGWYSGVVFDKPLYAVQLARDVRLKPHLLHVYWETLIYIHVYDMLHLQGCAGSAGYIIDDLIISIIFRFI